MGFYCEGSQKTFQHITGGDAQLDIFFNTRWGYKGLQVSGLMSHDSGNFFTNKFTTY